MIHKTVQSNFKSTVRNFAWVAFVLFLAMIFQPFGMNGQSLICPAALSSTTANGSPFSLNWRNNISPGAKTIPTVVHLVGGASGISTAQVNTAIANLNADFTGMAIEFKLARYDPDGKCTNGIIKHGNIPPYDVIAQTKWDNKRYLNIWVVDAVNGDPNILGAVVERPSKFSVVGNTIMREDRIAGQSPNGFDLVDGITIKKTLVPTHPVYGHTLTHEAGHWLNLLHIFAPCDAGLPNGVWDCCYGPNEGATNGDFIEDTNPQFLFNTANPAECGLTTGSCGTLPPNLDNFMGYAHPCVATFTQGQREWMNACLNLNRPYIWSEENLRCTGVVSKNENITANKTWDITTVPTGFKTITKTLTVNSNVTLTIAAGITVQFCDEGKIVVKPGGRLVLNGTLTSACGGRLWRGITVEGDATKSQFAMTNGQYSQGRFTSNTGAVVENSEMAAYAKPGGIIKAVGTTFRNNQVSVRLDPYENFLPNGQVASNSSTFENCSFVMKTDYPGTNPELYAPGENLDFFEFVDLWGVRTIRFLGYSFNNERADLTNAYEYGYGILSTNAGFQVVPSCVGPGPLPFPCPASYVHASGFENLFAGIKVNSTDAYGTSELPYYFVVKGCNFRGCYTGIEAEVATDGIIVQNNFLVGRLPYNHFGAITGLYLGLQTLGITVEENHFDRDPLMNPDIDLTFQDVHGIYASSLLEFNNVIRKNYFHGLENANRARGQNGAQLGFSGLLYLCNENTQNTQFDFDVKGYIRTIQGIPLSSSERASAGNLFTQSGSNAASDFNRIGSSIEYFWDINFPLEEPVFRSNTVVANPPSFTIRAKQCESHFCEPPCKTDGELGSIKTDASAAKTQYQTAFGVYGTQLDGGNTANLVTTIQTAPASQSSAKKAQLLTLAPWVSVEVLVAAVNRPDLFTNGNLLDILTANPEAANKAMVLEALDLKSTPFSTAQKNTLRQSFAIKTARSASEANLTRLLYDWQNKTYQILVETVADEGAASEFQNWLAQLDLLEADLALCRNWVYSGKQSLATNLLGSLPQKYKLSGGKLDEFNQYKTLLDILITHLNGGGTIGDLPVQQQNTLKTAAEQNTYRQVRGLAKNILAFYKISYPPEYESENGIGNRPILGRGAAPRARNGGKVQVLPNPANERIEIRFEMGLESTWSVAIFDALGSLVFEQKDLWGDIPLSVGVANYHPGVYYVQCRAASGQTETKTVIVHR